MLQQVYRLDAKTGARLPVPPGHVLESSAEAQTNRSRIDVQHKQAGCRACSHPDVGVWPFSPPCRHARQIRGGVLESVRGQRLFCARLTGKHWKPVPCVPCRSGTQAVADATH